MRKVYTSKQIKAVDELSAKHLKINSFELMQKASSALFSYLHSYRNLLIVTGAGNNAGDGFVIATLALEQGKKVSVWCLIPVEKLPKDAKQAANNYLSAGGEILTNSPKDTYECIVDAIFGTGLNREVSGNFATAIDWINGQIAHILSVDIPSGLEADTGNILGCAVNADVTVTIICYKPGILTNHGKDLCGQLYLEDLDIPDKLLQTVETKISKLDKSLLSYTNFHHHHNSHKGSFGKALVVGGHDGMLGALMLAGRSALSSGCGMVEVVSNTEQTVMISIHCPELITASNINASRFASSADVIAIGPGLGLNQQSKDVLKHCIDLNKPMVIDADAITLIANQPINLPTNTVLTPHPKEAASLLDTDIGSIQSDRISAAREISKKYQATVILKGSGTIIADIQGEAYICPYGYSGMATAGMGDVLTGMVASLMAQGFSTLQAANCAVVWHALSAENCNKGNCLIATDVIEQLNKVLP